MASIKLAGDTSGEVTISAPAVAGTTTLTLPATSSTLATQNALGVRNLIINGDMRIAQRGTSQASITSSGYYTVDRYSLTLSSLGTWTQSQDTDVPSGQGFANSLKMACTTADASPSAGDLLTIQHKIEAQNLQHLAYGTASAKTLTMSFWVKSNKTGTYNVHIYQNDDARQFSNSYTISSADTWEKKTITIPADTTGVIDNDNGIGLQVELVLGAGTNFTSGTNATTWQSYSGVDTAPSNVNLADSTSNYINITGVQLEISDGEATPFEHRPYDMELARCMRYFERYDENTINVNGGLPQGIATVDSANRAEINLFYTRKRANPTITGSSAVGCGTMANTFITTTGGPFTYVGTSLYGANLFYNVSSGIAVNSLSGINYIILGTGDYINIDAEL